MPSEAELDAKVALAIDTAMKGKYSRHQAVGRGAYGQVYFVQRLSDGAKCVAKVMAMEKMHRYESEVKCLAGCNHFGIVRLVDKLMSTTGPVIILDFADSGDLSKFMKTQEKKAPKALLSEDFVGTCFVQLVLALHHIHVRRMMHRDIKSANVLMLSNGTVKMSDFGFSRQFKDSVSEDIADTFLGTPYYLAPELWKRQKYSKKADVWSLGVVLYELMTLKRPFTSSSMKGLMNAICSGDFERPSSQYSKGMHDVLAVMLKVDTGVRASTATLLQMPAMQGYAEKFMANVAASTKISDAEKKDIIDTTREQLASAATPETAAALAAMEEEEASGERIIHEGAVQIGSTKEWKPRYIVLNDGALVVTRYKADQRSQRLELNTIVKVASADPSNGEGVLVVSLQTNYTVWIKAATDAERDEWIRKIEAARAAK